MKQKSFRKSILVNLFVIFLVLVLGGFALTIVEENVDGSQQSDNINAIITELQKKDAISEAEFKKLKKKIIG